MKSKLNVIVSGSIIEKEDVNELNKQLDECNFSIVNSLGYNNLPTEILFVTFELTQSIVFSASYDLLKMAILSLINKLRVKHVKKTHILIIKDSKKSEIVLPFEVTDEQKDRLIDAAIKKILN